MQPDPTDQTPLNLHPDAAERIRRMSVAGEGKTIIPTRANFTEADFRRIEHLNRQQRRANARKRK